MKGGFTICHTRLKGRHSETRRKFSVVYVVRPRTQSSNTCLCFTLMSKMPDNKAWMGTASRGVLLDLQEDCDWRMDSTVTIPNTDPITAFDDNMQAQCLPIYGADQPKWTYRKVPKVKTFQTFARLPFWSRRPKQFACHLCAEDPTKSTIAPALPEEERRALLECGVLPPDSSAKVRFCVMCPVKRGSPRLLPCCLCHNWCHIGCSYQTTSGQSLPMPCSSVGSKEKDHCTKAPIP